MIETWTWQIPFALVGGTLSFLAVLVPAMVIQYYAYGRLSPTRLLGTAALSVYGVALVAYTLLPLPDPAVCDGGAGRALQAVPGAVIADIARIAGENGLSSTFTIATLAQPLLNIALFIPLGVLVRVMTGRGIPTALLAALAASLLIETTQYTGLWGIYGCSYRVADVDDLVTNALGALVGALLAPVVAGWIPRPAALAALPPQPVTRIRRLLGAAIDAALISVMPAMLTMITVLAVALTWILATGERELPTFVAPGAELLRPMALGLAALLTVVLPALHGSGASPGQRWVGIRPAWNGRRGSRGQRLLRALPVAGVYAIAPGLADVLSGAHVPLAPSLLSAAAAAVTVGTVAVVLLVDRRGLSGLISGAEMVDRRTHVHEPAADS
ncbi:VanZ family protein [Brachybacterium fresconis]|uniref:Glycopeptide antibiotics resistance protein n=1 Tax=Brachybacterium fresconis TaxID=173363 RepID=A0ABS4YJN5_9MICO|nr:VanZ family protein [Brachybacterium fresconis]MBP2408959.1 glycopeptide antibiotics resistance protein [Brachybacterium fresconis]